MSLPVLGAWIEIQMPVPHPSRQMSLPVLGAWIEIYRYIWNTVYLQSLPVLGAWIEITLKEQCVGCVTVAPCIGSVD